MAVPWTWAFDTPFTWTKQIAVALRRHAPGHGDLLAEGDQGQGRHPQPVPPRHRHRADASWKRPASRRRTWSTASRRSRSKASAWPTPSTRRTPTRRRTHHTQYFEMMGDRASTTTAGSLAPRCHACRRGNCSARRSPDPASAFKFELYDLTQGLDAVRRRRRRTRQSCKEMEDLCLGEAAQVPGVAARRLGRDAPRHAASEPHRRPQRVHLVWHADHRHAGRRRAEHPQHVVHHQGRGRDPAGRRRGHDRDPGRPVRRLRASTC